MWRSATVHTPNMNRMYRHQRQRSKVAPAPQSSTSSLQRRRPAEAATKSPLSHRVSHRPPHRQNVIYQAPSDTASGSTLYEIPFAHSSNIMYQSPGFAADVAV